MRNPNKPMPVMDDTPKSKEDIALMIERMMSTDENGYPEKRNEENSKITA